MAVKAGKSDDARMKCKYVLVDQEVLGGTPVFKGTRVPVKALFDYLEGNHTLDDFIEDLPAVSRPAAPGLLKRLERTLDFPCPSFAFQR